MERKPPTTGEIVIMAAAVVVLVGSFLDFAGGTNAWGSGSLPIVTLIPIYGVIMGAEVALTKLAQVELPTRVAGFTWEQIHLLLGFFAALMAITWLFAVTSRGAGLWLLLVGSIGSLVGAVLLQQERRTGALG